MQDEVNTKVVAIAIKGGKITAEVLKKHTLWNAANRYLHAHLPEGVKTLPISAWEKEYAALKAQREAEYAKLKGTRSDLSELQNIRKCVDIALRADQPEQTQTRTKRHDIDR